VSEERTQAGCEEEGRVEGAAGNVCAHLQVLHKSLLLQHGQHGVGLNDTEPCHPPSAGTFLRMHAQILKISGD